MSQIWKQLFFTTQFSFADRQITITLGMARGKMRGKTSLWHIILQTPSLCIVTKSGVCKLSVWCWCCVMPATVRWYRWYRAGSFLSSPHPHTRAGARGLELVWCVMSRPHSSQPAASRAQSGHTQVFLLWSVQLSCAVSQWARVQPRWFQSQIPTARRNKYILFLPAVTSITSRCYMAPQSGGGWNILVIFSMMIDVKSCKTIF